MAENSRRTTRVAWGGTLVFGLDSLDVAIGLVLFFLIVSMICSAIREALEGVLKLRARNLERGVRELLDDPSGETLARSIYEHGQVYSLFAGDYDAAALSWKKSELFTRPLGAIRLWWAGRKLPSYIPSRQFASALIDIIGRGSTRWPYPVPSEKIAVADLRARVSALPGSRVQRAVLAALDHAQDDLEQATQNLERWFDGSMDRVSGWYKRSTQAWLFVIGLAAAVLLNLDALTVGHRLSEDKVLRQAFLAQAEAYTAPRPANETPAGTPPPAVPAARATPPPRAGGPVRAGEVVPSVSQPSVGPPVRTVPELRRDLAKMGAPTGWVAVSRTETVEEKGKAKRVEVVHRYPAPQYEALCDGPAAKCDKVPTTGWWLSAILGWLITAVAVTFGAPFWFDILNKFMVIRATVKPREKSREEGSEDRAPSRGAGGAGKTDGSGGPGGGAPGGGAGQVKAQAGGAGKPGGQQVQAAAAAVPVSPPPAPDPDEEAFVPEEWQAVRAQGSEVEL